MLAPHLPPEDVAPDVPLSRKVRELSSRGLRVLLFAHNPAETALHDAEGRPRLPTLRPLAVVSLADELRPAVKETIAAFGELGVKLKVISGDDPAPSPPLRSGPGCRGRRSSYPARSSRRWARTGSIGLPPR